MDRAAELWKHFKRNEELAKRMSSRNPQSTRKGGEHRQLRKRVTNMKGKKTHDLGDLNGLEFSDPGTEDGLSGREMVARIARGDLDPPAYVALLRLALGVIGDPPSIRTLACLIKNKLCVNGRIEINKHWASTFSVCFSEEANYLRCSKRI